MENIVGTVIVPEKVNFKLLEKAINIFVQKNDSFRTKIVINNGKVIEGHYEGNWYEDNSDEEGIWIKIDIKAMKKIFFIVKY